WWPIPKWAAPRIGRSWRSGKRTSCGPPPPMTSSPISKGPRFTPSTFKKTGNGRTEMSKLKLLAGIALLLAYAAGIATGWAGYTLAGEQPPPPRDRGSWLSHELRLSPEQKEKMEVIWSREARGDDRSTVRDLYDARNNEVRALLTEE